MYLSRKADYGLRLVYELAQVYPHERLSTHEVAKRQCIPEPFLAKIAADLARRGLLLTQRGSGGGVVLARDPSEITFLEVIEALDGPIVFAPCEDRPTLCCWAGQCAIEQVLSGARERLVEYLSQVTFADVLKRREEMGLMEPIIAVAPESA